MGAQSSKLGRKRLSRQNEEKALNPASVGNVKDSEPSMPATSAAMNNKQKNDPGSLSLDPTIYLITGANKGLGRGFVTHYLSKPGNTVIATIRNSASDGASSLHDIPKEGGSSLIVLGLDYSSEHSAAAAAQTLETEYGISSIDVLIANAGHNTNFTSVTDLPSADARIDFETNTLGTLRLFQAFRSLLEHKTNASNQDESGNLRQPVFLAISSRLGSAGDQDHPMMKKVRNVAYGMSKAAMNYWVKRLYVEEEWLCAFTLSPGLVATDMGNRGAKNTGMVRALLTVDESVGHMAKVIDSATRETTGGRLLHFDGTPLPF